MHRILIVTAAVALAACEPQEGSMVDLPGAPPTAAPAANSNALEVSEENKRTVEPQTVYVERVHLEESPGYLAIHADEGGAPGAVLGFERVQPRRRNSVTVELEAPLNARQDIWAVAYLDVANTNEFDAGMPIATTLDGAPLSQKYPLYFQSTTTVEDSPYYQYPCPFEQWLDDPTDFFVDCRCAPNVVGLDICTAPDSGGNTMLFGEGPRIKTMPFDSRARGGAVRPESKEVIFGLRWQDENHTSPGTIMAVNYVTGDRRIISGRWKDPNAGYEVYGDGPEMMEPMDLEIGPDGAAYVFAWNDDTTAVNGVSILRVDLETGDRTRVWGARNPDFPQCDNGGSPPSTTEVQFHRYGFTMDPDGNFYMNTISNGRPHSGRGILRIDADVSTCSYVTMDGVEEGNAYHPSVGEGYPVGQFNYYGLEWHEGALYSLNNGDLIRIDAETGDRRRIAGDGAAANSKAMVGHYLQWNPEFELMMVSGMSMVPEFVGGANIETGEVFTFGNCLNPAPNNHYTTDCFEGSAAPLGRSERQTWVLPNGNWIAAHGKGFVIIEPRTGNSHILSF